MVWIRVPFVVVKGGFHWRFEVAALELTVVLVIADSWSRLVAGECDRGLPIRLGSPWSRLDSRY